MRKIRHGTIAGLLAVVAALLAINLAVIAPGQKAHAAAPPPLSTAVAFHVEEFVKPGPLLYRMFRDGTVERNQGLIVSFEPGCPEPIEWCGWETVPD